MPHLTLEYSANLQDLVDIQTLCSGALEAACSTGVLPLPGTRVRAVRCDHFAIADQKPQNAFIDAHLRIGAGRTAEQKRAIGDAIFKALSEYCSALLAEQHFAVSLEIREIDPDFSWKNNSIRKRW